MMLQCFNVSKLMRSTALQASTKLRHIYNTYLSIMIYTKEVKVRYVMCVCRYYWVLPSRKECAVLCASGWQLLELVCRFVDYDYYPPLVVNVDIVDSDGGQMEVLQIAGLPRDTETASPASHLCRVISVDQLIIIHSRYPISVYVSKVTEGCN